MYLGQGQGAEEAALPDPGGRSRAGLLSAGERCPSPRTSAPPATGSSSCSTSCTPPADPRTCDRAEELLRLVTELYGAGLGPRRGAGPRARSRRWSTPSSPTSWSPACWWCTAAPRLARPTGWRRAWRRSGPFLATHGGDVELLGIDDRAAAVKLRLLGSCDGCPSSAVTLQSAVERAIMEAAPEIVRIDVDEPTAAPASRAGLARGRSRTVSTSVRSEMATR